MPRSAQLMYFLHFSTERTESTLDVLLQDMEYVTQLSCHVLSRHVGLISRDGKVATNTAQYDMASYRNGFRTQPSLNFPNHKSKLPS